MPSEPQSSQLPANPAESTSNFPGASVDSLTTVLALVEQVSKIVQKVPFIALAAALMSELLKAYKVRQNNFAPFQR